MYYVLGSLQLIFIILYTIFAYKKENLTIFADGIKLVFILWVSNIGLYNLQISKLYNPNLQINIIVLLIALTFFIASRKIFLTEEDLINNINTIKEEKKEYNIYSIITTVIFIISSIVFWMNIKKYGLAILSENKIDKQPMNHYSGYIVYMLVLVAQIKYILFRVKENKKIIELIVFILSLGTLFLTLNRGPLIFIIITIYIYEIFNLVSIKRSISKKILYSLYGLLIILGIIGVVLFGYMGDMRMEYVLETVYKRTINEHYQVSELVPSGFMWVYIYLTSPLENAAFSIVNQGFELTFFNNLFYPFIKLFANILGFGNQYKEWLLNRGGFEPYLQKKVGLNVSSFIPEAMQDFGYLGVVIYIAIYVALIYFAMRLIKKSKESFSRLGSLIIYSNVLAMLFWSVFVNSLKIPVLILNILFIIFIEICIKFKVFYILEKKFKKRIENE